MNTYYPKLDMVEGRSYRFVHADGNSYGDKHEHWGWVEGEVYIAGTDGHSIGPVNFGSCIPSCNWGGWVFEEVEPTQAVTHVSWNDVVEAREKYEASRIEWLDTLGKYQLQRHYAQEAAK